MFGVLVVRYADGRLGALKAFSGQLDGRWRVPGFAPPVFDEAVRGQLERESDVIVKRLGAQLEEAQAEPEFAKIKTLLSDLEQDQTARRSVHKAELRARKEARAAQRVGATAERIKELDDESRRDDRARRRFEASLREEWSMARRPLEVLERRLDAMARLRRIVSQEVMRRIQDAAILENRQGERRSIRALFAPVEAPWGAGDCAAPKLFAEAHRAGLTPVALAEFWWGAPPAGGGRVEGVFFPACREKCGPLLPFMLAGLEVAPRRRWATSAAHELRVVYEDARLVVVEKPEGLLSVRGTDPTGPTVHSLISARYPQATGPLIVHRLDLDTSGLMVLALDAEANRLLQAQFIQRSVEKRYVALVEGLVAGEEGEVSLPLRVDLEQRPRQLVDHVHGRPALTRWRRLGFEEGRTRLELIPHTGRTHQLRVHCAHEDGLGHAMVGDRLYGAPATTRLHLHAATLAFDHPSGHRLRFESKPPF